MLLMLQLFTNKIIIMKMNNVKLALITFLFFMVSCIKNSDYIINNGLNPDNIVSITSINPIDASADSATQILIRVKINSNADSAQAVILTTSSGIINGKSKSETANVNVSRYADFILTTGQTYGPVALRASVLGSYFKDTIITLAPAYPDTIIVLPDNYNIPKGSASNSKINFVKYQGYPSKNQTILLTSLDSTGNIMGQYIYSDSFNPGTSLKAVFTPLANYTGKATLKVVLIRKDGTRIFGQTQINIQ
jgi:hypothetical protein